MTENTGDDRPVSVMFDHCRTVYDAMLAEAQPAGFGEEMSMVWEGRTTHLFSKLGMSVPYYTSITRSLKAMGCAEQLRRGGGNTPSQWRLIKEPTEEDFQGLTSKKTGRATSKTALLEQQMRDLRHRVDRIEEALMGGGALNGSNH